MGAWPGRPIKDRRERREGSPSLRKSYKTFEKQLLKPKGYGPDSVSGLFFFRANTCREAFSAPPASLATTSQKSPSQGGTHPGRREPGSLSLLLLLPAGEHCKHLLPSLPLRPQDRGRRHPPHSHVSREPPAARSG